MGCWAVTQRDILYGGLNHMGGRYIFLCYATGHKHTKKLNIGKKNRGPIVEIWALRSKKHTPKSRGKEHFTREPIDLCEQLSCHTRKKKKKKKKWWIEPQEINRFQVLFTFVVLPNMVAVDSYFFPFMRLVSFILLASRKCRMNRPQIWFAQMALLSLVSS